MARPHAWLRGAAIHPLLRGASAEFVVSRGVLYRGVDRHPRSVCAECDWALRRGRHGAMDVKADVSVRLLSDGAGGGGGDGARSDASGQARHFWRGRGAGVVLHCHLDCGADAGDQLGGVADGEVYGTGSATAGEDAAGNLPALDSVLLLIGVCGEVAAHAALLLGGGGGGGVRT